MNEYDTVDLSIPITESRIDEWINYSNICLKLWDADGKIIDISLAALGFFGTRSKETFYSRYDELSPAYQPDGRTSKAAMFEWVAYAFEHGTASFDWLYKKLGGRYVDCHINMHIGEYLGQKIICAFISDHFDGKEGSAPLVDDHLQINEEILRKLKHREVLLNTVNRVAETLLTSNENFITRMTNGMEIIGRSLDVDRIYLWRNEMIDDELCFVLKNKWERNGEALADTFVVGTGFPYSEKPGWFDMINRGAVVNTPVSKISPTNADFIKQFGAKSILILPLSVGGSFFAALSITDHRRERTFTDEEINVLRSAGMMLFNMYQRIEQIRMHIEMEKEREVYEMTKQVEAYTKKLLDNSPLFMEIWDVDGNMIDCNQKMLDVFGISNKFVLTKHFYVLAAPIQPCGTPVVEKNHQMIQQAIREGSCRSEWMFILPSGEKLPVESTWAYIEHQGKPRIIVYSQDLRPIKEVMHREREAIEMAHLLLNSCPMFMEIWDENAVLVDVSDKVVDLFSLSCKEEFIERYNELSPEYQPCGTLSSVKAVEMTKKTHQEGYIRVEWIHRHPISGENIPVEITMVKMERSGKPLVVGYNHDLRPFKASMEKAQELELRLHRQQVDERSRIAIAEASNRTKSRFLAHMSHEIRTPMSAIIGMLEIAGKTNEPDKKDYCLNRIEEASQHLMAVINNILDMSKIEADRFELNMAPFSFKKVLNQVVAMVSPGVEGKCHCMVVDLDESVPDIIVGDELRLTQVMLNLMSNAVKFTPEYGVISVIVNSEGAQGAACGFLRIEVSDTGIGIPLDQQTKIFNTFEQVDSGLSRQYGGAGLGLAISKRIIDIVGGGIRVESEEGKGSKFIILWPYKTADENAETLIIKEKEYVKNKFNDHTILIAEDIEINREILEALLEETGLRIEFAVNGIEAVDKFKENPDRYSLILMDMQMPEMDGCRTTEVIRTLDIAQAKTVPIIAMTANVFREDVERCLNAGMNDHLGKPIDSNKLYTVLKQYLQ